VDEAAAKLRTEIDSMPSEIDEIHRRVLQLEIEQSALKKEKDPASRERLGKLEKELADLRAQENALTARWQEEKQEAQRLGNLREAIEKTKVDIERAQREYDLNKAAELKYGTLMALETKLKEEEERLVKRKEMERLVKEE